MNVNGYHIAPNAKLHRADLSGADLSGANLTGADLSGANLTGADLTGAELYEANLRNATLTGADLSRANLRNADLFEATLRGADLSGADLTGADLPNAKLSGATLTDATLTSVDLTGVDLFKAALPGAGLDPARVETRWQTRDWTTLQAFEGRDTSADPMHLRLADSDNLRLSLTRDIGTMPMQIVGVATVNGATVEATITGVDDWTVAAALHAWFAAVAPAGVRRPSFLA